MLNRQSILQCVCAAVLFFSTAAHADQVKNPDYARWEKFKPGAYATLEGIMGSAGHTTLSTMTTTLLEISEEKAVIETRISMKSGPQTADLPPTKQEIKAYLETGSGNSDKPAGEFDPKSSVTKTQEKLTIKDKTYDCDVVLVTMNRAGNKIEVKTWYTPEVPGGQVKIERTSEGKIRAPKTGMLLTEMSAGTK